MSSVCFEVAANGSNEIVAILDGDVRCEVNCGNELIAIYHDEVNNLVRIKHRKFRELHIALPINEKTIPAMENFLTDINGNFRIALRSSRRAVSQKFRTYIADFAVNRSRDYKLEASNFLLRVLFTIAPLGKDGLFEKIDADVNELHAIATIDNLVEYTKELLTFLYIDVSFDHLPSQRDLLNAPIHGVYTDPIPEVTAWCLEKGIVSKELADNLYKD